MEQAAVSRRSPRVVRRTDKELREIARGVIQGRVFITNDPHVLRTSFGLLLSLVDWREGEPETIGAVYGNMSDAGDRYINGYPMFFACRFLHVNDMPRFDRHWQQMAQAIA